MLNFSISVARNKVSTARVAAGVAAKASLEGGLVRAAAAPLAVLELLLAPVGLHLGVTAALHARSGRHRARRAADVLLFPVDLVQGPNDPLTATMREIMSWQQFLDRVTMGVTWQTHWYRVPLAAQEKLRTPAEAEQAAWHSCSARSHPFEVAAANGISTAHAAISTRFTVVIFSAGFQRKRCCPLKFRSGYPAGRVQGRVGMRQLISRLGMHQDSKVMHASTASICDHTAPAGVMVSRHQNSLHL